MVIKSTKEALEWLTSGACVHIIMCIWKEKGLYIHPLEYTEFSVLCGDSYAKQSKSNKHINEGMHEIMFLLVLFSNCLALPYRDQ